MKPITYWIQNKEINQLVDLFGPRLEKLAPNTRRELIAYLAVEPWGGIAGEAMDLQEAYNLVGHFSRSEKDLLIEAIAATLTHKKGPDTEGPT